MTFCFLRFSGELLIVGLIKNPFPLAATDFNFYGSPKNIYETKMLSLNVFTEFIFANLKFRRVLSAQPRITFVL